MGTTGLSAILRGTIGVLGGLAFVLGVAVTVSGDAFSGLWILAAGAVLILVPLYEHGRYRAHGDEEHATVPAASGPPGPSWPGQTAARPAVPRGRYERTDEVFDDPTTGERLRVWFDPVTGDRRYETEP